MSSTLVYQQTSHSQTHSSSPLSLKLNNPSKDTKCMWTAIESLSSFQKQETEIEYVHPSAKRPSMSERSLEMCTESLDSETGVFFTDSYLNFSATSTDIGTDNNNKKSKRQHFENNNNYSFPPPLTTMMGSNSLQVRPYREDGRLVIQAVLPPLSRGSCFKAERVDGRLRMSLVREREEVEEEEEEEEDESEVAIEEGNFGYNKNNINNNIIINNNNNNHDNDIDMEEKEEEGLDNKSSQNEMKFHKVIGENKNGVIKVEFGGKMGKGENNELSQRSKLGNCRCKQGGRGNMNTRRLNNWEPFWVAT